MQKSYQDHAPRQTNKIESLQHTSMIRIQINKELSGGQINLQFDLTLQKGAVTAIFGESGAGKTCLLRMLAGLLSPDNGHITVQNKIWFDSKTGVDLKPQHRSIGFVFQHNALFPNLSVLQNLEVAAKKNGSPAVIEKIISLTELKDLLHRMPETLSGGQKQRVVLARAIVQEPQLLLLDEPLSALDFSMRTQLQELIINVHRQFGLTTLIVSHDIGEVLKLADFVVHLENGNIKKQGPSSTFFGLGNSTAKFRFRGEIISIKKEGVLYLVEILIGNDLVSILADRNEIIELKPGDQVMVGSKAFNPIMHKI